MKTLLFLIAIAAALPAITLGQLQNTATGGGINSAQARWNATYANDQYLEALISALDAGAARWLGELDQAGVDALSAQTGDLVWNTATADLEVYDGAAWRGLIGGGSAPSAAEIESLLDAYYGNQDWRTPGVGGGSADNLGNHTATQDLDLDGNDLLGIGALAISGELSAGTLSVGGEAALVGSAIDSEAKLEALVGADFALVGQLGGGGGNQTLSIDGQDLSISSGNTITLPTVSSGGGAMGVSSSWPGSVTASVMHYNTTERRIRFYPTADAQIYHESAQWSFTDSVTPPAVSSVSVNGAVATISWDRVTSTGAAWALSEIDFDMSSTGADIAVASLDSGDGTSTWGLTLASAAVSGETINMDLAGSVDAIESDSGADAVAATDIAVTNDTPSGYVQNLVNNGGGDGTGIEFDLDSFGADSEYLTYSVWYNFPNDTETVNLLNLSGRTNLKRQGSTILLSIKSTSNVVLYACNFPWAASDGLQHLHISADLSAGSPDVTVTVNGVTPPGISETAAAVAGTIDWTRGAGAQALLGFDTTAYIIGDLYIDTTQALGTGLFGDLGTPMSLTGVGSPVVYFGGSQTAADWNAGSNQGSLTVSTGGTGAFIDE